MEDFQEARMQYKVGPVIVWCVPIIISKRIIFSWYETTVAWIEI